MQCNGNGGELNKFMIELDKNDETLTGSSPQCNDGNDEVAEDAVVGGLVSGHQGSR